MPHWGRRPVHPVQLGTHLHRVPHLPQALRLRLRLAHPLGQAGVPLVQQVGAQLLGQSGPGAPPAHLLHGLIHVIRKKVIQNRRPPPAPGTPPGCSGPHSARFSFSSRPPFSVK